MGSLKLRESVFVFVLLFCLATLGALSFAKKHALIAPRGVISVKIVGAVVKEQHLKLLKGATFADLSSLDIFSGDVDFDKIIFDERLKPGVIIIPKKGKTSIWVTGAVKKSGLYSVPEGTTFNQLISYIPLEDSADIRYFTRKRRKVSEGEELHVPIFGRK